MSKSSKQIVSFRTILGAMQKVIAEESARTKGKRGAALWRTSQLIYVAAAHLPRS